jgi:RimJ/RimL family protein N-acetyltransferase
MRPPEPITLRGRRVVLEPLAERHASDLFAAAADPEIWRYLPIGPFPDIDAMRQHVRDAQALAATGRELPLAICSATNGTSIGGTCYLDISLQHGSLEIGRTWLSPAHWQTAVNTECKFLLLRHAFEDLGCARVLLKTDALNLRSQRAIERLGAPREGLLRRHMAAKEGRRRDTVVYGITDFDWPGVRTRLLDFLREER